MASTFEFLLFHASMAKTFLLYIILYCSLIPFSSANTIAIDVRTPFRDSIARKQIKDSKVVKCIEYRYDVGKRAPLERLISTTMKYYDPEGNEYCEVEYSANNANVSDSTIFSFNSHGNILKSIGYNLRGRLKQSDSHLYDSGGRLLESNYFDKDSNLWHKRIFERDSVGRIIREISWARDFDGWNDTTFYEYDSKGALICLLLPQKQISNYFYYQNGKIIKSIDVSGNDTTLTEFQYSKDERREIAISYRRGACMDRITHFYDINHSLVESVQENPSKRIITTVTYSMDKVGKVSEIRQLDSAGRETLIGFAREDDNGNLIESASYDSLGTIQSREKNTFDSRGNRKRNI
jgi:antitoxin component YwqK of YwqJK toxin-antitoxin module